MRRTDGTTTLKTALAWMGLGCAALALIVWRQDERVATLIATVVCAQSLLYTRYYLRYGVFSAPFLYLAALGVFHLGLVLPWSLGVYDPWEVYWFNRINLNPALLLVTLAFVCCQLGLIVAGYWGPAQKPKREIPSLLRMEDRTLMWAGAALLALGIAAYLYGAYEVFGGHLSNVVYTDIFRLVQERDSRWFGIGVLLVPTGLYAAAAGASRRQLLVILLILGAWMSWQLFLGSRSGALIPAIVIVYICVKKQFIIARRMMIPIFLGLMYLIPLVSTIRLVTASERFDVVNLREAHPLRGLAEMGNSIYIVAETYRLVGDRELRQGMTYVEALKRVVPSVSYSFQPGEHLRAIDYENSPAYWFVVEAAPWLLKDNLGLGFSSVAEAYMNFGVIGVGVIFLLLGGVLARIEVMSIRNPYLLGAQAIILAPLLWTVRNDLTIFTRAAIWGCVFIAFVWWFSGALGARKERGTVGSAHRKPPAQPILRTPAIDEK